MTTFPATALDTRVELLLGSTWTDVTPYCDGGPAQIGRGHPDESTVTSASTLTVPLRNDDGRFSALNPAGPYYGQLVRNTPVRVSIPDAAPYLRLETDQASYASCPDAAAPALVQVNTGSVTGTTLTVTLTNPTTAGNCLVVAIMANGSSTNPTVSTVKLGGAAGNFASVLAAGTATFVTGAIWNDPNCAGGQTAVAVTSTGGSGTITLAAAVYEFSGLATSTPFDKSASAASASTASSWSSTATATLTQASEVAVGLDIGGGTALALTGPGAPWVNTAQFGPASNSGMIAGYNIVSATTALTYAGTVTPNSAHTTLIATFKAAVASPPLQITSGTLSVRADVKITDWTSNHILAAKEGATGNAWALYTNGNGTVAFNHYDAGGTFYVHSSTLPVPYFNARIAVRADYDIGGQTVTFYTAPTMAGSWTQLGTVRTTAATTQAAAAGQAVQAGNGQGNTLGMLGEVYEVQLLATGVLVADPVFTAQTAGTTTFADVQGNTWTLAGTAEISGRKYRFHGEVPEWPQSWSPVSTNVYVTATGAGLLRRKARTQAPVQSAMRRSYVRLPSTLRLGAYWSGEDGSAATQIGPAVGKFPMGSAGLTMGSFTGFACSDALPVMNGGTATATVDPGSVSWTDNVVRFLLAVPAADDTNGAVVARFYTQGAVARVDLLYGTGGVLTMSGFTAAGASAFTPIGFTFGLTSGNAPLGLCRVSAEILGSGVANLWVMTPGGGGFGGGASAWTGSIGGVTGAAFGGGLVTSAMGHWSVQGVSDSIGDLSQPLNAWAGETAGNRFARLCSEENVACRMVGRPDVSVPLGAQSPQTITALLQECADADRGTWFEPRQVLGWGYRPGGDLCNQPVTVPLDYSQNMLAWPLDTTEDDQTINNDVTASRPTGSAVRAIATDGMLIPSVAGTYDTSLTVNVNADTQLADQAGWSLRLGTVNEPRYPAVNLDLTETGPVAALFDTILDADLGDRVQIASPPGWLPPGPVDFLIQDWTETLDSRQLDIAWAGVPASPWTVGVADDPVLGHADTAGCQMHAGATFGAGTIQVDTTLGPLWTTNSADYPFDLTSAGMTITVSGCSGASNPQTFTVSAWGVNGVTKNLLTGQDVRLAHPMILAMAGGR